MASLLPLIQDLLPMIMPSSIHIAKSDDNAQPVQHVTQESTSGGTDTLGVRVVNRDAIVNKTDKMCASVMLVKPKSTSLVRHFGEQDAIVYVASGKGVLLTSPKGDDPNPERYDLAQGDFAFIPAWTEHQALNETEEDLVWVVTRSGPQPVEVDLTDWGGPQKKSMSKR